MMPTPTALDLEVEEILSRLSDQAAKFCEMVAEGLPPEDAYARAGLQEGGPHDLMTRWDVRAAISALRQRVLGDGPADARYLRMLLLHAAHQAHAQGDHRGLVNAVRAVAELDGLYPKEEPLTSAAPVLVHVSLQLPERITPPSYLTVNAPRPSLSPSVEVSLDGTQE
jgi:hypothetical protein